MSDTDQVLSPPETDEHRAARLEKMFLKRFGPAVTSVPHEKGNPVDVLSRAEVFVYFSEVDNMMERAETMDARHRARAKRLHKTVYAYEERFGKLG